jgi:hypothetical protein
VDQGASFHPTRLSTLQLDRLLLPGCSNAAFMAVGRLLSEIDDQLAGHHAAATGDDRLSSSDRRRGARVDLTRAEWSEFVL